MKIPKFITGLLILAVILLCINTVGVFVKKNPASDTGYTNVAAGGFVVNKKVTYSDITTTGVDISNTAIGTLLLKEVIIRTDSVAVASGTIFSISTSGNDYGTSTVFSIPVAQMLANSTFTLTPGQRVVPLVYSATSSQATVLEDGTKLVATCSVADCKGKNSATGYMYITMFFDKMDSKSYMTE